MKRYAETFFRYWLLILAPIVLVPVGTYALVKGTPRSVTSTANIWVNQPLGANTATNQFETPAQNEADAINQLLQSPTFDLAVADGSSIYRGRLAKSSDPRSAVTADLARNILTNPVGPNLLQITYKTDNWNQAPQVVQSLITNVAVQTVAMLQQETQANIAYWQNQLPPLKLNASDSANILRTYLRDHKYSVADIPTLEATDSTLATLYQQSQADQAAVNNAESQLVQLSSKRVVTTTGPQQSNFHVQDSPNIAVVSQKKQQILDLAIGLVLGLLLGLGFMVTKTLLDRSIRYAGEVPELLGLPVLAVVPYYRSAGALYPGGPPTMPKNPPRDRRGLLRRIG